jgi:cysteine desulfurase
MIYLDNNASTPVDPRVRDAMLPYLGELHGNPSSPHGPGRLLRQALEDARGQVSAMLGATPEEIVFTASATEANNTVLKGIAAANGNRGRHIITSKVEHPSVLATCRHLESAGFEITYVPVDRAGRVDATQVVEAVRPDTILISIMHANNEVGTIQPIEDLAEVAREGGVYFHTDAAQSCGKIPVRVDQIGPDFLTLAGHKMYAPQGVGVLYIRKGVELQPLLHGAGHESGRRSGTEAVALIVGLGVAAATVSEGDEGAPLSSLRDRLLKGIRAALGAEVVVHSPSEGCLPNTLSLSFPGHAGSEVLAAVPELSASAGAACHGDRPVISHVLAAMSVPDAIAKGAIRLSVGRMTTEAEIDEAVRLLAGAVDGSS